MCLLILTIKTNQFQRQICFINGICETIIYCVKTSKGFNYTLWVQFEFLFLAPRLTQFLFMMIWIPFACSGSLLVVYTVKRTKVNVKYTRSKEKLFGIVFSTQYTLHRICHQVFGKNYTRKLSTGMKLKKSTRVFGRLLYLLYNILLYSKI